MTAQKITKAIIPVAGWGTRRLPITKIIEKSMLPVGNRPLVDYSVQELVEAGVTDIYMVISNVEPCQVRQFYQDNLALNQYLIERGKEDRLKLAKTLPDDVKISCTAVRVPVFIGHSEAVSVEFSDEITPEGARDLLSQTWGVEIRDDIDNFVYPTPKDAAGKNPVYVGRIRKSIAFDNGLDFFCVADNLRIGAALNTVRIAEKVIEMGLY